MDWDINNTKNKISTAWEDCGAIAGFEHNVRMRVTNSFGEANTWKMNPGSELRI